ncbi:MAG: hypothetical protein AB1556_16020 [Bacillota bacterium]
MRRISGRPARLLMLVLAILFLSGCAQESGWKALTGRGDFWEARLIVELRPVMELDADGVRKKAVRVFDSFQIRYIASGNPAGPIKVVTRLPELDSESGFWSEVLDRKWLRSGAYGSSNKYMSWPDVDRLTRSGEVVIAWQEAGETRTETVAVYDSRGRRKNREQRGGRP